MELLYRPIGYVYTPFESPEEMPIQPMGGQGVKGTVVLEEEFAPGLKDVDGFSHLILLYHFHRSQEYELHVVPFMDDTPRGVFATRAPKRPNAIGISVVRLVKIEGSTLHVEDLDIVNGTPVLDIKPFIPDIDRRESVKIGWLTGKDSRMKTKKSDKRFAGKGESPSDGQS